MKIHLIWAQEMNGGIGKDGMLPWHISEDLQNFKKLTLDSTILMGRKTWESLPIRPLPKRRNIVLSSKKVSDIECYTSTEECIEKLVDDGTEKLFVIGGSTVYRNFIHRADELHITYMDEITEGIDTYFPVTMLKIKKEFKKINEIELSKKVIYTQWVRKKILSNKY